MNAFPEILYYKKNEFIISSNMVSGSSGNRNECYFLCKYDIKNNEQCILSEYCKFIAYNESRQVFITVSDEIQYIEN